MVLRLKRIEAQKRYLPISILFCLTQGFITILIYIALQCIRPQCITPLSLALLCIAPLPIELLCIPLQCILLLCITLLRIPDTHKKDPNFFVNVRTCMHTDFIDFLGFKSVFKSGILKAFLFIYE
jgi:hypothetical protein